MSIVTLSRLASMSGINAYTGALRLRVSPAFIVAFFGAYFARQSVPVSVKK
jgi:hypothetical protein